MGRRIYNILLVVLVLLMLFSGGMVAKELLTRHTENAEFEELTDLVTEPQTQESTGEAPEGEERVEIKRDLTPLFEKNSDCVGWVCIEGTRVNYPVMHTPSDPEKYIHRNFYGKYSYSGVPFMEGATQPDQDHIIIYGHNMKNDTMFSDLENYRKVDYWTEHPYIELETAEGIKNYAIFAVALVDAYDLWYDFFTLQDQADLDAKVAALTQKALYPTAISPQFGKQLLTLSTCYGSNDDGRLIVVGVEM